MPRILVIGYAPEDVDFADPAVPSDLNAEAITTGIEEDMKKLHARGWEADHLPIYANEHLYQHILDHLQKNTYDCIVIGGGVRLTTWRVPQLEQVMNAIREGAPKTPIAFNEGPDTSSEAAARWIKSGVRD